MDKVKTYKSIASKVVNELSSRYNSPNDPVQYMVIEDTEKGNYLIFSDGWVDSDRFYGCYVHIEVKLDGKVWVRHDGTEDVIIDKLLLKGVQPNDIVMGWLTPYERQFTDFAVA